MCLLYLFTLVPGISRLAWPCGSPSFQFSETIDLSTVETFPLQVSAKANKNSVSNRWYSPDSWLCFVTGYVGL